MHGVQMSESRLEIDSDVTRFVMLIATVTRYGCMKLYEYLLALFASSHDVKSNEPGR
jgi:hypothetical protein